MRPRLRLIFVLLLATTWGAAAADHTGINHGLQVRLDLEGQSLEVVDSIRSLGVRGADADGGLRFVLHAGLDPEVESPGWRLERMAEESPASFLGINATSDSVAEELPLEVWRLVPEDGASEPVVLRYGGRIHHDLATSGEEYQRSFSETPGIIDERGVFLAGASYWIPTFGNSLMTFDLEVAGLAPPWDVVSQGRRTRHELAEDGSRITAWRLDHPTEEVYLVAGPWVEYSDRAGEVEILAFLREDDPALAAKYLEATKRYLKLYEAMLPAFPYRSFALVENFWETGYGMPGFTLLGSRIIRFPWILTSSYPHELLHNWWGNSVYVDFDQGNWCEGLTAYMADHLFAEQRGDAGTYRRATLKKYSDFVTSGNDFPLSDFSSRRSAASEAVGYGKSLMLYHMVRRAIGDELFLESMSAFYNSNQFDRASFDDIATAVEATAGGDWRAFFAEWTGRMGAPSLTIQDLQVTTQEDPEMPWKVRLHLAQSQPEAPFSFTVPVAITMEGHDEALIVEAGSCHRDCVVETPCAGRPLRIDVDPAFDVMRRLDPLEVPPALSTVFGASEALYVLPASASDDERAAWRELAAAWAKPADPRVVLDSDLDGAPESTAWILGWDNLWAADVVNRVAVQGVELRDHDIRLVDQELGRADHSLVLVARSADDPAAAVGFIAADPVAAIPGLGRKLPHYTRYSYLAFKGDEPENVAKGMWQPLSSPLVRNLGDGELSPLVLPDRAPLAELPAVFDAAAMLRTVTRLADPKLEGRGLGSNGLAEASAWVESRFQEIGLQPAGDDGYRQNWNWTGGDPEREMSLTNLIGRLPGTDSAVVGQPVVILAHLDHLGRGWPDARAGNAGMVHPGADDNASGVAVLLELAEAMAKEPPRPRPVVFAVVTGEEAGRIGSRHLMAVMAGDGSPFACVNLDSVGRLADGKLFVLNADSAREWRFIFMGVGYTTGAPVEVVAEPLDSSDQMSCIEVGVPAVQLFTGPHADYHRPSDTADVIDGPGMAVVAEAAHEAVGYLAERIDPMTVTISGMAGPPPESGDGSPRRASLGTMPDFSFEGPGVRVQQVMPGSAAETAGILAGDVVMALDGQTVEDLRGYSALLKTHGPGDAVTVTIVREGVERTLEATLGER